MNIALTPVKKGNIEDFCSARDAAAKKGVSVTSVYDAIEAGKLGGYQIYGQTVVRVAEVNAWGVRQNKRRLSSQADKK